MKKIVKLSIFPILAVIILIVLIVLVVNSQDKITITKAEKADKETGVLYADYFTANSVHEEWQLGDKSKITIKPTATDDALLFNGYSWIPAYATLNYDLPEVCNIYFTAELARIGESSPRDSGVFLNVGGSNKEQYILSFQDGILILSYNEDTKILKKAADELKVGKRNSYCLSLKGATLELYVNGSKEPLISYTGTEDYATLADARGFGVYGRSSEFWFDDLVITDGATLNPVTDLTIAAKGSSTIEGIGTQLQMQALINPSNSTDKGLVWSVDDKNVADISINGMVTAKDYGVVTVTASTRDGSGVTASYEIEISEVTGAAKGKEVKTKTWCLADESSIVFETEDPYHLYPMSPYVVALESGRILATFDLNGEGISDRIPIGYDKNPRWGTTHHVVVAYSDDEGESWKYSLECPGLFARAFEDGDRVYMILRDKDGHLAIRFSEDDGLSWSEEFVIDNRSWHSAPTSIIYKGAYLYMTMEVNTSKNLAPILLRAKCGEDLTKAESWTFSEELTLWDIIPDINSSDIDYTGIPEYSSSATAHRWLEGNVFQVYDEDHVWYDESMNTFYIYLRATIGRSGYAAIMKVTENEDGTMTPSVVTTEAGNTQLYVAMPGGHDKFSIIYDEESGFYWLASNYSDDSMISRDYTTGDKQGTTYLERDRLALYFSKDALNWNFAGIITEGDLERESRAYPCITVDGDDLLVVTRYGTEESSSLHDNNILSFHRIEKFRDLIY